MRGLFVCFLFTYTIFWALYGVVVAGQGEEAIETCDLLIKYVDEFYGIGVYAGKDFETGTKLCNHQLTPAIGFYLFPLLLGFDPIQTCIGIPVPLQSVFKSELINYLEWYNATHGLAVLGYGMLYNHIKSSNHVLVRKFPSESLHGIYRYTNPSYATETSRDLDYESNGYIELGEQIFSNYGPDWFEYRQQVELEPSKTENKNHIFYQPNIYGTSRINKNGRSSTVLPGCGPKYVQYDEYKQNFVAARALKRGTVLEVSRALLLPDLSHSMSAYGALTEFLWWRPRDRQDNSSEEPDSSSWEGSYLVEYDDSSAYAVLLTGFGALYHAKDAEDSGICAGSDNQSCSSGDSSSENAGGSRTKGADVNVKYDWWSLDSHLTAPASSASANGSENQSSDSVSDHTESGVGSDRDIISANEGVTESSNTSDHSGGRREAMAGDEYSIRRTRHGDACSTQMFVAFTAARDIAEGETLTVDLTRDMQRPWIRYTTAAFASQCL